MNRNKVCHERQLVLYHYDELAANDRKALESHLSGCSDCRALLKELQASLAAVPQPQYHLSAARKLRFAEQVLARTRRRTSRNIPVWGGALAVGALVVTILLLQPADQRAPIPAVTPATADFEVLEQFELLQELDLLEKFDLLQEMEQFG